mgnify:CR=1
MFSPWDKYLLELMFVLGKERVLAEVVAREWQDGSPASTDLSLIGGL